MEKAVIFIIILAMNTIPYSNAQEPVVISGYGASKRLGDFGKDGDCALFVQERARIVLHPHPVYVINLTEESTRKIGNRKIGVVYVNNAGIILPPYLENEQVTLEVFPVKENNPGASRLYKYYTIPLYFCKHYEHRDSSKQSYMKMDDDFERDITRFLEHPPVGDTIHWSVIRMIKDRTDSRYTPLLIKNLTTDGEVTVEYENHYHTIPDPSGKGDPGSTYYYLSYESVRISDLVRERLGWIFHSNSRNSLDMPDTPATDAPAEKWQMWLAKLLEGDELPEK
jgi:hypothetical protein